MLYNAIHVAVLGKVILCVGAVVPIPINHAVSMNKDELVLQDFWFCTSKVESQLLGEFVLVIFILPAALFSQLETQNIIDTALFAPVCALLNDATIASDPLALHTDCNWISGAVVPTAKRQSAVITALLVPHTCQSCNNCNQEPCAVSVGLISSHVNQAVQDWLIVGTIATNVATVLLAVDVTEDKNLQYGVLVSPMLPVILNAKYGSVALLTSMLLIQFDDCACNFSGLPDQVPDCSVFTSALLLLHQINILSRLVV